MHREVWSDQQLGVNLLSYLTTKWPINGLLTNVNFWQSRAWFWSNNNQCVIAPPKKGRWRRFAVFKLRMGRIKIVLYLNFAALSILCSTQAKSINPAHGTPCPAPQSRTARCRWRQLARGSDRIFKLQHQYAVSVRQPGKRARF